MGEHAWKGTAGGFRVLAPLLPDLGSGYMGIWDIYFFFMQSFTYYKMNLISNLWDK